MGGKRLVREGGTVPRAGAHRAVSYCFSGPHHGTQGLDVWAGGRTPGTLVGAGAHAVERPGPETPWGRENLCSGPTLEGARGVWLLLLQLQEYGDSLFRVLPVLYASECQTHSQGLAEKSWGRVPAFVPLAQGLEVLQP